MSENLERGTEVTFSIPFTYTIGEEGYHTNRTLQTLKDCEDEAVAEIESGALNHGICFDVKVYPYSTKKKDEIEKIFIDQISRFGIDIPANYEDIVQFIYEDVCETADIDNWNDDDVRISFRRWIESNSKTHNP